LAQATLVAPVDWHKSAEAQVWVTLSVFCAEHDTT
jgi:hypothetical protein